jgi:hypothetical protein
MRPKAVEKDGVYVEKCLYMRYVTIPTHNFSSFQSFLVEIRNVGQNSLCVLCISFYCLEVLELRLRMFF